MPKPSSPISTVDRATTTALAYHFAPATVSVPGTALMHVSGQVGTTEDGRAPADYESQVHLALLNLKRVVFAAGAAVADIAKLTLYYVVERDHDCAQRHVQKFLGAHRPAVTLVPVQRLAQPAWLFQVDAVVDVPIAAAAAAEKARAPSAHKTNEVDVIIIGAGLAGLTAAESVLRAGLSCVVLEARDRVGGKCWSRPTGVAEENGRGKGDGVGWIDLGAAWINDSNQSRMIGLARRFGAELIEQNTSGDCALQDLGGGLSTFPYGELPRFDAATVRNVAEIRDMVEAHCQAVDVMDPRDCELDSVTFEAYLRARGAGETALATATLWTRAMLGQEPADISALFFLHYCRSGGGLLQMRSDRRHGGQYLRVRKGTQLFSHGLAAALPAGVLELSSPVASVASLGPGRVEVRTSAGRAFLARKVVSSVPSPALATISFSPPLPPAKRTLVESATYGYYTKVMMVFRTAFWVGAGFCGLAQSFVGPAGIVRDTSVPVDDKHVLTCFMVGEPGRAWSLLPEAERRESLLEQIGRIFQCGYERARDEFIESLLYEWTSDEYAGWGCPCAALPPGVLDAVGSGALREPVHDVHFVGTETAGEWKGYMEGAVRSGERGADEVISELKKTLGKL